MAEPQDDDSSQSCDGIVCCEICENSVEELYHCQACGGLTFCPRCWKAQAAHIPRMRATLPVTLHEKTMLSTIRVVRPVFSNLADNATIETRLAEDADTAWFGVSREGGDDTPLFFHDHGRYAEIMATTARPSAFRRQSIAESVSPNSPNSPTTLARRTPSLVSFVGQAGAGKSTLIKLLILLKAPQAHTTPQCPVVGVSGGEVPTSEDVHLYFDPSTCLSDAPILYADCEGLDGGEREPLAAAFRRKRNSVEAERGSDGETSSFRTQYSSKRELQWAKSQTERTRHFAVSRFYPRLLFTFSDVVIFVHRNPRVIESVLEKLIKWAATALETACNQPILPHAIIILNASQNDIDPKLWDVDFATRSLLDSLSATVNQNATFAQYSKFWRERHRVIENVEELMMCYYSSIRVVRLPTDMQPNLVLEQAHKLYAEIEQGCRNAREHKSGLRMLLDAEELQSYLQDAFDLYCQSLDVPFDFVQASFLHNPIPFNFGGNILKLAIAMIKEEKKLHVRAIFSKLGNLVASCIMLDAVRHNIPGTANLIFPQYLDYLDEALQSFCDRHWPCEYSMRGITPASLQYDLSNRPHFNNIRSSLPTYRCINVRIGHGSKGHQNKDGRIFARGDYFARFSFENNQEEFQAGVYFSLKHLLGQLADCVRHGESQEVAAAKLHRVNLLEFFQKPSSESAVVNLHNRSVCWCCLFEGPEHSLSCGHVLCTPCLKAYGRSEGRTIVRIHECPFESHGRSQPRSIYIKPESAGIRMLVLDNGGVRSIIQLEILRLIEKELNGRIPLQIFFDLIVGSGSGSIVALSLLTSRWTVDDCIANFLRIFKQSFMPRNRRNFSGLKYSTCKYRSKALEQSLREAFTENQPLLGAGADGKVGATTKLAIPVVSSAHKIIIFSNYVRRNAFKLPYHISSPEDAREELKAWEATRAAMAHPFLFKPFKHRASNQVYSNQEQDANTACPIMIADSEFGTIWGSSPSTLLDIVVSLGSGLGIGKSAVPTGSGEETRFSKTTWNFRVRQRRNAIELDQQSEKAWSNYIRTQPSSSAPLDNHIRLNITAVDLPAVDDIDSVEDLRNMVRTQINPQTIRVLTFRLVAKLFFFEKFGEMDMTPSSDWILRGEILCRIPDGAPEISEVGKLLKEGKFRGSEFIIQEQLCERQYVGIPLSVLEDMIHQDHFHMPEVSIRVSEQCGEFDVVLRLENTEEYSISGFPRLLAGKGVQTGRHTRDNESSVVSIRRRSQWTPPTSARYSSFFDSSLELSDGSHSVPIVSPSAMNLATSDTPLSRRRSKGPPYELDAVDTREPRTIREEMKLQYERDRVRNEEVAPLEERVRKLEATQLELTSLLAGLRSPSSEVPAQLAGTASQDLDDTPLINLNSSSPSRTNTVRHEKQIFEENSNFNDLYDP